MQKRDFERMADVVRLNRLRVSEQDANGLAEDMANILALDHPRSI